MELYCPTTPVSERQLISRIRGGFRPLQPLARGTSAPLPDFPVVLPAPAQPAPALPLASSGPCDQSFRLPASPVMDRSLLLARHLQHRWLNQLMDFPPAPPPERPRPSPLLLMAWARLFLTPSAHRTSQGLETHLLRPCFCIITVAMSYTPRSPAST